jgi:hypothetical protein
LEEISLSANPDTTDDGCFRSSLKLSINFVRDDRASFETNGEITTYPKV